MVEYKLGRVVDVKDRSKGMGGHGDGGAVTLEIAVVHGKNRRYFYYMSLLLNNLRQASTTSGSYRDPRWAVIPSIACCNGKASRKPPR